MNKKRNLSLALVFSVLGVCFGQLTFAEIVEPQQSLELSPYQIIGTDNRREVGDGDISKYDERIAYLYAKFPDGFESRGTGVVLGYHKILTAGHVLYDKEHGGKAISVKVYPKAGTDKNGKTSIPYGPLSVRKIEIRDEYISQKINDFAVITVKEHVSVRGGTMYGLNYLQSQEPISKDLAKLPITVTGYPKIKYNKNSYQQYTSNGAIKNITSHSYTQGKGYRILHNVDTSGGQSGAPIVSTKYNQLGLVYGIHSGYKDDLNVGWLITKDIYNWINVWE